MQWFMIEKVYVPWRSMMFHEALLIEIHLWTVSHIKIVFHHKVRISTIVLHIIWWKLINVIMVVIIWLLWPNNYCCHFYSNSIKECLNNVIICFQFLLVPNKSLWEAPTVFKKKTFFCWIYQDSAKCGFQVNFSYVKFSIFYYLHFLTPIILLFFRNVQH